MNNYDITGWSAGGRQSLTYSLKAGQKRGMGRANIVSNNIFINNYAPMPMHTVIRDHSCNNGMSGFEKLMLGLGAGSSILGMILGAFGIGGGGGGAVEGAGDNGKKTEEPSAEVKELQKKLDEVSAKAAAQAEEIAKLKNAAKQQVEPKEETQNDFINGGFTKVHDEKLGSKADITGTVTVNSDGTVSIKDVLNTYTYQKSGQTVNYNGTEYPVYTLTGAVNNQTGKSQPITTQQYILMNGQLVQPSDLDLSGTGIGSVQKNTAQSTSLSEGTGGTKNNVNRGTVNNSGNNTTPTGVPYKNLNSYDSISDPSVRGNAKLVNDAINKLPQNQRAAFSNELNQIIKDFRNSNDFGAKMDANNKLTNLLNKIPKANTNNTNNTTNTDANIQKWNKEHPGAEITKQPDGTLTMRVQKSVDNGLPGASVATTIRANNFNELIQKQQSWLSDK